jgi:hypothetical protein
MRAKLQCNNGVASANAVQSAGRRGRRSEVCTFHFWEARTQVNLLLVICLAAVLVRAVIAIAVAIIFSCAL